MTQIIKADKTRTLSLRPAASPLIPAERSWARREAGRILERARQQAREIIAAASRQARHDRQQAMLRGRAEGRAEFARRLEKLLRLTRRQRRRARQQAVELAGEMARRILDEQLRLQPESLQRICQRVLRENPLGERVLVRVHPSDRGQLQRLAADLERLGDTRLLVKVDDRLTRGDLLLEGDWGQVDAWIDVPLQTLQQVISQLEENHDQP